MMGGSRIRAQRSVEVMITLNAQEAADLVGLLAQASYDASDGDLLNFFEDLQNAITESLRDEGVSVVQPRIFPRAQPAAGGTLFSPAAMRPNIEVPRLPEPTPDPEPKPQVVDARSAAGMEPRQGMKPIFK
jgi:hypothetical protein